MSEKKVLIDLGHVRIVEKDHISVIIERYEKAHPTINTEIPARWRFKGYASTIYEALGLISHYEWLVDRQSIEDLDTYLKQIHASNDKVLEALNDTV